MRSQIKIIVNILVALENSENGARSLALSGRPVYARCLKHL